MADRGEIPEKGIEKGPYDTVSRESPNNRDPGVLVDPDALQYGDTQNDLADMQRLGKKQEFKRNFSLLSTLGFISIYMATWEYVLVSLSTGLTNGGFGGLFWVFIATVVCYSSIVASLAEMESMAPTSGGQYHWVSEFAPAEYQKFLSYAAGWMSTLGWLSGVSSSVFVMTTLIQAIIDVAKPDYAFTAWQYTLIMLASLLVTIVFNTWWARALPALETMSLFGHLGGLLLTIIPLLVMAPKNSAHVVFVEVVNNGGWSNTGTACLIAQVSVIYCNLGSEHDDTNRMAGSDSAVHISEEVEDASLNVPRAMWWSYVMNVILGIAMLITMLFCIGDLDTVLGSSAPYLTLFQNTGSNAVAFVLMIYLFILIALGNITALATTSRELWAFSRDKGFPLSKWISKMDHKHNVPNNSVYLTAVVAGILCLINLGSTYAFNIIVSLNLLALLSTYMISIGCVLRKRLLKEELPPARWSLGRMGIPINAFAFVYSAFIIVFSCFPITLPVGTGNANWAPLVWVGVIILSLGIYFLHGKKHYTPPVVFVEGRREAGVGLQGV
ncbi:amino acid transporter-like protein [Mollisia scopiformis]|uniref:Amino acid transporter-like protein n=1 Tax=Mollisia scopiformis TaxID=149040 RepID=A0A194WXP3_MOLSC|nr:amino acid transporter-like protein [Mollisia scopiformis]KUJ12695.1 amino acid transporter-like protein [Mollisia scopiformis]